MTMQHLAFSATGIQVVHMPAVQYQELLSLCNVTWLEVC